MANTIPSTLVPDIVEEAAITTLGPLLSVVNSFTHQIEVNPIAPGASVKVGVVTAGATASTNPSSYESGDSTKVQRSVTVDEHNVSFHATQAEMNNGHRVSHLVQKNMQVLGNAIRDALFAPITEANFGSAVVDKAAASFAPADTKTIWAACKDFPTKNLILDGGHYAQLLPTNAESFRPGQQGAYGFDSIHVNNRWDGAGTDIIGFCGTQDALVYASGEPQSDDGLIAALEDRIMVEIPGGLMVYMSSWVSLATRARWSSLGVMFGAAAGDTTAGKVIEGATD
jgi:hypothetical protein